MRGDSSEARNPSRISKPGKRPTRICFQCRNRKVRCDGTLTGCENCLRLGFACSFSGIQDTGSRNVSSPRLQNQSPNTPRVLERRRGRKACLTCHSQKAKCSGECPCERCSQRGIECQYSRISVPVPVEIGPGKGIVRQHIDAFFEYIYPIPGQTFLHRAIFLQNWSKDAHNPHLLQAICGATARYLAKNDAERQQAATWIDEAEDRVLKGISEPSLSTIETLLIIIFDRLTSRRFGKVMALSALVVRFAFAMRLNYTDKKLTFVGQERRRRLMWSIFMSDTLLANGRADFTLVSAERIHLQLPCHERDFSFDTPVETEMLKTTLSLNNQANIGMMGYLVRILEIRVRIQKFTHEMVDRKNITPQARMELDSLAKEVEHFSTTLPSTYVLNERNFCLRAYTPERTTYIMLHVWWNLCYCDLYRFTIPGFHEALPDDILSNLSSEFLKHCHEHCLKHALDVANIFESILKLGRDIFITDTALAICALQCARILKSLGPLVDEPLEKTCIIMKSTACSDILRRHSELYPTSRLLRGKIQEIIRSVERDGPQASHGLLESRSCPENTPPNTTDTSGQFPARQVYTKHSFLSETRQMAESHDADELVPVETELESQVLAGSTESARPEQIMQSESMSSADGFATGMEGRKDPAGLECDMTWMLGPEFAMGNNEYDLLMDPFLRMQDGVENGPWNSERLPGSDQNDTFYF